MSKIKLDQMMQFSWACISTFLIWTVTGLPSEALNILPGTGPFRRSVQYQLPNGGTVQTTLDLLSPIPSLNAAGLSVLSNYGTQNGWNFITGAPGSNLTGNFIIGKYYACGPYALANPDPTIQSLPCGPNDLSLASLTQSVGAYLTVAYSPTPADPPVLLNSSGSSQIPNPNLYWIQVVSYRNSAGVIEQFVDNGFGIDYIKGTDPYYPKYQFLQNLFAFEDASSRNNFFLKSQKWTANLFLAQLTGVNTVTIYSGISWGWTSTFFDPSSSSAPPSPVASGPTPPANPSQVCTAFGPTGSCEDFSYYNALFPSTFGSEEFSSQPTATDTSLEIVNNNTNSPTSVPEPASTLGLLAVGMWGGTSWRRRAKKVTEESAAK